MFLERHNAEVTSGGFTHVFGMSLKKFHGNIGAIVYLFMFTYISIITFSQYRKKRKRISFYKISSNMALVYVSSTSLCGYELGTFLGRP